MYTILLEHLWKTMDNLITIEITQIDAIQFRLFQQYYSQFALLANKGVFDTKNGSVTLHFDSLGTIQEIKRNDIIYDKKHEA